MIERNAQTLPVTIETVLKEATILKSELLGKSKQVESFGVDNLDFSQFDRMLSQLDLDSSRQILDMFKEIIKN